MNDDDFKVLFMLENLYTTALFTKLDEIETKGVKDYTKEFYNMFEVSQDYLCKMLELYYLDKQGQFHSLLT